MESRALKLCPEHLSFIQDMGFLAANDAKKALLRDDCTARKILGHRFRDNAAR